MSTSSFLGHYQANDDKGDFEYYGSPAQLCFFYSFFTNTSLTDKVNNNICVKKHLHLARSSHISSSSLSMSNPSGSGPNTMDRRLSDGTKLSSK